MARGVRGSDISKGVAERAFDFITPFVSGAYDRTIGDSWLANFALESFGAGDTDQVKQHMADMLADSMNTDTEALNAELQEEALGWAGWALMKLETWFNPEGVTARTALASDVRALSFSDETIEAITSKLGDSMPTLAPEFNVRTMLQKGRNAAATSLSEPHLWSSLTMENNEARLIHLQHAHDAATVAMARYVDATLSIDLPEEKRVSLIMELTDAAATGITGVPSPNSERHYLATDSSGALSNIGAGLAAYVTSGTHNPVFDPDALQAASENFATSVSSSAQVEQQRLARIGAEVAQLSLTGIANETTQNKIRESLTELRSDDRITDVEFTNIQTALRTDARGIDMMLESLAGIDSELIEDVVIPNGIKGDAIIDLQDGTDVVPENAFDANAEKNQFGYKIAAPVIG